MSCFNINLQQGSSFKRVPRTKEIIYFVRKLQALGNFIKKETLAQVFSCEFCEISKNIFSYRTPPVAASLLHKKLKKSLLDFFEKSIFFL